MKKLIFSVCMVFALVSGLKAQQDPEYSMYMFNGLFINPAYAGSQEVVSLMAIYRHQWAGFEGAPRTANISVHTPFRRDQYAAGLVISNDMLGFSNTFNVTPSFAYRLKLGQTRLSFGMQASFAYYYLRNSDARVVAPGDNAFTHNENLFVPNIGFGVYWYGKKFFIGASVPHLLPAQLRDKTGILSYSNDKVARIYNQYIFTAGYVFGKDPAIVKFRPTILLKYQKGLPHNIPQFDASLALLFVDRLWVGVTYRTGGDVSYVGQAIIGFLQFKVTPQLQIGYAYDAELTSLQHYTSGTHEIMVGYDFWYNKKRFVTPRYVKYF